MATVKHTNRQLYHIHCPRKPGEDEHSYLKRLWYTAGQYDFARGRLWCHPHHHYWRTAYQLGFDDAAARWASHNT